MAKYRVLQTSFIDNALVHEGAVVEYDGEAGPNLELIAEEKSAKGGKGKPQGDGADLV